jgi:hypothetical protein
MSINTHFQRYDYSVLINEEEYKDDENDPCHWKYTLQEDSELLGVDDAMNEETMDDIFFV